jgi:hypothetical protein
MLMSTLSWIKNNLNILDRNKLEVCGTTCPCDICYPMPVYVSAHAPAFSEMPSDTLFYSNKYNFFIEKNNGSWEYVSTIDGCKCSVGQTRVAFAYGWQPLLYHFPWYFAPIDSRKCAHVLTNLDVWRSEFWKYYNDSQNLAWLLSDACGRHLTISDDCGSLGGGCECNMIKFASCEYADYDFCKSQSEFNACLDGTVPCCASMTINPNPPLDVSSSTQSAYDEIGYAWSACFDSPEEAFTGQPIFGLKFAKFQLWWKLWEQANPELSWRDIYQTVFSDDEVYEVPLQYVYSGIKYPFCCHQNGLCTGPVDVCPDMCSDSRTYVVYTFEYTEFTATDEDIGETTYHALSFDSNGECALKMEIFSDADGSLLNVINTTIYKPPISTDDCPPVPCEEWTTEALIARAMNIYNEHWTYTGVLVKKDGNPYTDIIKLDGTDARVVSSGRFEDDCGLSAGDVKCDHCAEGTTMVLMLVYTDEPVTEDSDPVCGYAYYCITGDIEDEYYGSCYSVCYWTDEIYDENGDYCGRLLVDAVVKQGEVEGYRDLPPGDPNAVLDIYWTPAGGSPTKIGSEPIGVPDYHCMDGSTLAYCDVCDDGKYYGIHVKGVHDTEFSNGSVSCYCGFAIPYIWDCAQMKYYKENPAEFIADYTSDPYAQGYIPTWSMVAGPFDTYQEASDAIKKYSVGCQFYASYTCEPNPFLPMFPKSGVYCVDMFTAEAYSGADCVHSSGDTGSICSTNGSRNAIVLTGENADCHEILT